MGPSHASLLLTKLPLELRTLIWEYTLRVPPTNANNGHGIVWLTPDPRPRPSVLALLLTCRQIKRETEDIFYRINRLAIHVAAPDEEGPGPTRQAHNVEASVAQFLKSLSPRRLSNVHSLCIWLGKVYQYRYIGWTCGSSELHTICKRLRRVPNLKTLHLMWDQPTERSSNADAEDKLLAVYRNRGIVIQPTNCFPPAFRPGAGSEQEALKCTFIPAHQAIFDAIQMLRQVEEVTIWGRDDTRRGDPWLASALQTYLPRYRAKHGLELLYSSTIKKCRYMCAHGCESLDCQHLRP